MAKVQSPFLGLSASGALGKTVVYSVWKGILYTRRYVIPANPNTAAQQEQRGFLRTGVSLWHSIPWLAEDFVSWRRWASYMARPMSGFNHFISLVLEAYGLGNTWIQLYGLRVITHDPNTIDVAVKEVGNPGDKTVTLYAGVSQGYMVDSGNFTWQAGTSQYQIAFTGFMHLTNYYFRVIAVNGTKVGEIGDFLFRTD